MSRNKVSSKIESYLTNHPDDIAMSEITPCDMLNIAIDEIDRLNNEIQRLKNTIEDKDMFIAELTEIAGDVTE